MPRFRLSLRGVGMLILCFAISLMALKESTGYWAAVMSTIAMVVLLGGTVAAIVSADRAGWIGFAVFGWGYAVLGLGPVSDSRAYLLTSVAIAELFPRLHDERTQAVSYYTVVRPGWWSLVPPNGGRPGRSPLPERVEAIAGAGPSRILTAPQGWQTAWVQRPDYRHFEQSAHALFALLFGGLGNLVGRWVESRRSMIQRQSEGVP